ncbi:MAG TPA: NYN domain-containing protein [Anaerolineales bacterium]|nr:NYN domain-containing protein [Anaerolineales bacterium]
MPYLVDGHNLIPSIPGLRLSDPDDESQLIGLLQAFCARARTRVTVYFDRGVLGPALTPGGGGVTVRFVRLPRTADEAIAAHLNRLGGEARNWTVVSSDGEVRSAARRAGARALTSPAFALRLSPAAPSQAREKPEAPANKEEVAYWERQFRQSRRRR